MPTRGCNGALWCRPKVADGIALSKQSADHPGYSSSACCYSTSTRCATASRRRCAGASQASCQCCLPPRTSYSGWPYSRFSSVPGAGISVSIVRRKHPWVTLDLVTGTSFVLQTPESKDRSVRPPGHVASTRHRLLASAARRHRSPPLATAPSHHHTLCDHFSTILAAASLPQYAPAHASPSNLPPDPR